MNTPDDKAFDEYLGKKSPVSQHYRGLDADEVPAHLDAQILFQARGAVVAKDEAVDELAAVRAKRGRLMRWSVPAAIAASALLVVSIVIRSGTQHEVGPVTAEAPSAPAAAQSSAAKTEAAPASAEQSVVMIAPPRDAVTEFSSYGRAQKPQRDEAEKRMSSRAPTVAAPAEITLSAPAPLAAPAPPPPAAMAVRSADALRRESATASARQQEETEQIRVTSARAEAQMQASGVARSAAIAEEAMHLARLHATPEDWLEHIRQLRRDGEEAVADREWQQFQETYPEHVVPENDLARSKTQDR